MIPSIKVQWNRSPRKNSNRSWKSGVQHFHIIQLTSWTTDAITARIFRPENPLTVQISWSKNMNTDFSLLIVWKESLNE